MSTVSVVTKTAAYCCQCGKLATFMSSDGKIRCDEHQTQFARSRKAPRERIVGEATKNWPSNGGLLISQQFEKMIAVNKERGYTLESWQYKLSTWQYDQQSKVTETIIAVFLRVKGAE